MIIILTHVKIYLRGSTRNWNGPLITYERSIQINEEFDILANTYRVYNNVKFLSAYIVGDNDIFRGHRQGRLAVYIRIYIYHLIVVTSRA